MTACGSEVTCRPPWTEDSVAPSVAPSKDWTYNNSRRLAENSRTEPTHIGRVGFAAGSQSPDSDAEALANVVRAMVPLVQVLHEVCGESETSATHLSRALART